MEDRYEISFEEGGVGTMETIMTGGLAKVVEKTLDTITGDDDHGWDCTIKDTITGLKVTCWGVTKEKAQEKALNVIEKDIENFEYEQEREQKREEEKERELERIQLEKEQAEREKQTYISSDNSTSSNENGCIKVIAWIVGIGLAVFAIVWLAINIVLPVALLNSALIFTILTFVFKNKKTLFASLALVGGAYMILDVTNGWFSSIFINNVVRNPNWISGFVYLNALAIGFSTWLLVLPIWQKSKLIGTSNKRNEILLKIVSIFLVVIALSIAPVVYNFVPNQFTQQTYSKSDISARIENPAQVSTPQNIENSKTLPKDTHNDETTTENSIPINTQKIQYGSLSDIDGNNYNTVTIGNQIWMAENLKTTKLTDSSSIPNVTEDIRWKVLKTEAYCDNDNTPSNSSIYGRLYNWLAVNTGKLCPTGWHVSTDEDWVILIDYLGGIQEAAKELFEAGTSHWNTPNEEATNKSGFTALPGGYRNNKGTFGGIGSFGGWWTSSYHTSYSAYAWYMKIGGFVNRCTDYYEEGNSVRCVKDN